MFFYIFKLLQLKDNSTHNNYYWVNFVCNFLLAETYYISAQNVLIQYKTERIFLILVDFL